MSYTITIMQTKTVSKAASGTYTIVGHEYLNQASYDALSYDEKKQWKWEDGQYCKAIYDYPPKREVIDSVSFKLYEQVVEELDVKAVVEAVLK